MRTGKIPILRLRCLNIFNFDVEPPALSNMSIPLACLCSCLLVSLTENGQGLGRRYAESTIASDMSKIMDSMVQKNFVNFLLNQREKKSMSNVTPEEDPEARLYNNLLKKLALCIRSKGQILVSSFCQLY
uniref:Gastric inhibitory polypeptide n=1 Tax=Hucho hucho TaxID=62062 RepID=A0A4W5PQE8_9TELE